MSGSCLGGREGQQALVILLWRQRVGDRQVLWKTGKGWGINKTGRCGGRQAVVVVDRQVWWETGKGLETDREWRKGKGWETGRGERQEGVVGDRKGMGDWQGVGDRQGMGDRQVWWETGTGWEKRRCGGR